jgi:hypothetical protein
MPLRHIDAISHIIIDILLIIATIIIAIDITPHY